MSMDKKIGGISGQTAPTMKQVPAHKLNRDLDLTEPHEFVIQ